LRRLCGHTIWGVNLNVLLVVLVFLEVKHKQRSVRTGKKNKRKQGYLTYDCTYNRGHGVNEYTEAATADEEWWKGAKVDRLLARASGDGTVRLIERFVVSCDFSPLTRLRASGH
jgi:hypothetical protein